MKLLLKPGKIFRISDGCPGFNYSATLSVALRLEGEASQGRCSVAGAQQCCALERDDFGTAFFGGQVPSIHGI